ncbi:valine--tRNA ligase [Babesia ovata]|uniref:Valine--tRNA ligase n=1 Tax=Babesia ovata TaxID=189622 RepID=A0A2H6KB60_9APIC|nr:valine--tRNA ligase [Babesia ovata]GBE60232.1 valine--tRNA ligase [Babesia ovata]
MWIQRLQDRYGKKFDCEPSPAKPDPFREESLGNVRRLWVPPFFGGDFLRQGAADRKVARRRGLVLCLFSTFSICAVFYMWFHCYKASCRDCSLVAKNLPDVNEGEVECHCSNCIVNFFFSPSTHFEKCYYSLLFFSGLVVFYLFAVVRSLAFQIFRHSNLAQRD